MGLLTGLKAMKAYQKHSKGDLDEARRLYEEALNDGMDQPRYILAYAVLLIRSGEFQKAKDLLVRFQKAPGMSADQKVQLFMNYAACCFKLGEVDKGISILERQHAKQPTGLVYETLGYLYVEKYDREKTPDFDAIERAEQTEKAEAAEAEADETATDAAQAEAADEAPAAEQPISAREAWAKGIEKAEAFCLASLDYDDEDAICLDNTAQFYYRVAGDKAKAREYFDKAIAIKDSQIDTLWFLSRYDLENGDKAAALAKLERALGGRFSPLNFASREMIEAEVERLK